MPISTRIVAQNPWWGGGAEALEQDPKLLDVKAAPIRWDPPMDLVDLSQDGVYTLRGQRQVGKSTYLKLLARTVMARGWRPRDVLYVDAEAANARTYSQLAALITSYLDHADTEATARKEQRRRLLLLDEVTGVSNWQTAIRVLADAGRLRGATIVASGSNCKDIKSGGDRLPRRRGRILDRDLVMQPLSFRDYLRLVDPELFSRVPVITGATACYDPVQLHTAAEQAHLAGSRLLARFGRYLATGGFLVSVAEEMAGNGAIPEHVYLDYRSAVLGEVVRMGRREATLRPIVQVLRNRLGEELDWRDLAREAHIASHETVRDLLEDLELAYLWHIYYRTMDAAACRVALKSPKRLYPLDPFTWHVLSAWSNASASGWASTMATLADSTIMGKLAESVVADHLRRMSGRNSYYFRTRDGEEIDFVTCAAGRLDARIEVKYQNSITGRDHQALRRHGGGLLLTKDSLQLIPPAPAGGQAVAVIPIAYALAIWPAPSLFPVRDT